MSANFAALQSAISNYLKANSNFEDKNKAVIGIISKNNVVINNKTYYADKVSDMAYQDGDYVYCLLPDFGQVAAVIGKL